MPIDLPTLKTEVNSDPTSLGLAVHVTSGDLGEVGRILNERKSSIQVDNTISSFDLEEAVDPADWPTPGNAQWKRDLWRDILLSISSIGEINANASNLKAKVLLVFDPGTNTRSNLAALQLRDGSRIEEVFDPNDVVTHFQIAEALAL